MAKIEEIAEVLYQEMIELNNNSKIIILNLEELKLKQINEVKTDFDYTNLIKKIENQNEIKTQEIISVLKSYKPHNNDFSMKNVFLVIVAPLLLILFSLIYINSSQSKAIERLQTESYNEGQNNIKQIFFGFLDEYPRAREDFKKWLKKNKK